MRVHDDSSSAAELVQPRPTVTQPQQSGQQMVPDALTGCSPATIRHDTANSDWRESFFCGVSQPPVRQAAVKAMIRMESQRCSPLETAQVAAAVGVDGRPWVDHRAVNTSSRGGGGCGSCGGGGDGGSPGGGVEDISHDVSPFDIDSCDLGEGSASWTREIICSWCWALSLRLRNIGVAQTPQICVVQKFRVDQRTTPNTISKSRSLTTQNIRLKRHTREVSSACYGRWSTVLTVFLHAWAFSILFCSMLKPVEFFLRSKHGISI